MGNRTVSLSRPKTGVRDVFFHRTGKDTAKEKARQNAFKRELGQGGLRTEK